MKLPFNIPDEYIKGFFKAADSVLSGETTFSKLLDQESVTGEKSVAANLPALPDKPMIARVATVLEFQLRYIHQHLALLANVLATATSQTIDPLASPARGDRRFNDVAWRENPALNLLHQSYLMHAQLLRDLIERVNIEPSKKKKLRFFSNQLIELMSPANFAALNPDVVKFVIDTGGRSLVGGAQNLLGDLRKGGLTITDEEAFDVGENVAASAGSIIFENELFQLIQYAPLTDQVAKRPLLIVPPCINKFYILDLQPANSFVRYAVEQGQTVFLVSWRNPDASAGHLTWDDYIEHGVMQAITVAHEVGGADQINALGFCVGGTMLSSTLAVLRARGEEPVASLTLLTTMLDFKEPGDLGVFIDEKGVSDREKKIGNGGIYAGAELGFVFQAMKANDLIWPNVINNYLKGNSPSAFDLLYWNSDTTNLPGPMYTWYLRNMYLENNLIQPDKLTMCGTPLDLGNIDMPSFVLATKEDHIVPWQSAYKSTQLVGGRSQFVLGASGHIAGVINPPVKNKRSYWSGGKQGGDPQQWLAGSTETPGSWWTHWSEWLAPMGGDKISARKVLGDKKYQEIEPAPGRYVKVRA